MQLKIEVQPSIARALAHATYEYLTMSLKFYIFDRNCGAEFSFELQKKYGGSFLLNALVQACLRTM